MRICKVMGYGLCDFTRTDDKRLSKDNYITNPNGYSFNDFRDLICDLTEYSEIRSTKIELDTCVHYGEMNGDFVICVIPPNRTNKWIRLNDSIDEAEGEPRVSSISYLEQGLPSYRSWMDIRDGRHVSGSMYYYFKQVYEHYISPKFCAAEKYTDEFTLADLASDMGFNTMDDVVKFVVPCVPTIVERLCVYMNLFVEPKSYLRLRPMVYTYWK